MVIQYQMDLDSTAVANMVATEYDAGMYLYRITALQQNGGQAGDYTSVKKMVLLK